MPKHPQYDPAIANIFNVVLIGTFVAISTITVLLCVSFALHQNPHILLRLAVCALAFVYTTIALVLMRRNHYKIVAYLIILFYTAIATGILFSWGINTPIGLLIFGLVIVLAGILLTAYHALIYAAIAGFILALLQTSIILGIYQPDISWTGNRSSFGDVLAYCTVFCMLSLVSWLYNRKMERSLMLAKQAEAALLQQKATLKLQVKQRTAQLRQAQLEEMQQMYRFAELGQLGVTLLHDMANHLTSLTLEIEGLKSTQHAKAISRARRIIRYLEAIVTNTRERLHGSTQKQTFNIIGKTTETVKFLTYKAKRVQVTIDWQPPARSWSYVGDAASLCQVIAILINNAIDAYGDPKSTPGDRRVLVTIRRSTDQLYIRVSDWGKGIAKKQRPHLFKPFHSTKKAGLGLGLFIAQQTIQAQFNGAITLDPISDHTEFTIRLPQTNAN